MTLSLEYYEKEITSAAKGMREIIESLQAEIATLKTDLAGHLMEVPAYPKCPRHYDIRRKFGTPDAAEATCKAEYEACEKASVAIQDAVKHNAIVLEKAIQYMRALGFRDTDTTWVRNKTKSQTAGWLLSLRLQCGRNDGWSTIASDHKANLDEIAKWRSEREVEQKRKQREFDRERKKSEMFQFVGRLMAERGWEGPMSPEDALEKLLSLNKYLRLAHFMQKNRGDWTDGPEYAETGLDGFTVEDAFDIAVHSEIGGLISDWDGDGRVFRDCDHNYGVLFAKVAEADPKLEKDYQQLSEYVDSLEW